MILLGQIVGFAFKKKWIKNATQSHYSIVTLDKLLNFSEF